MIIFNEFVLLFILLLYGIRDFFKKEDAIEFSSILVYLNALFIAFKQINVNILAITSILRSIQLVVKNGKIIVLERPDDR